MTDTEYMDRAEAALAAIEQGCDRINDATDADIDNQRVGGMITISFRNGSQLIVNLQKPLQEIWLAARSGGYHYRHNGQVWVDTKTGKNSSATCRARRPCRQASRWRSRLPDSASPPSVAEKIEDAVALLGRGRRAHRGAGQGFRWRRRRGLHAQACHAASRRVVVVVPLAADAHDA